MSFTPRGYPMVVF